MSVFPCYSEIILKSIREATIECFLLVFLHGLFGFKEKESSLGDQEF